MPSGSGGSDWGALSGSGRGRNGVTSAPEVEMTDNQLDRPSNLGGHITERVQERFASSNSAPAIPTQLDVANQVETAPPSYEAAVRDVRLEPVTQSRRGSV